MTTLATYSLFHLNLNYSSLDVAVRPAVIKQCYWPLLKLASEYKIPLAIECTGYTLECIKSIDPLWVETCASLINDNLVELIGSGYSQLIGPIVPAEVMIKNLEIGQQVYQRILNITPKVALVNEQAFSAGLVEHYLEAGFEAIMMEWNNAVHYHPEWKKEWLYHPQYACGTDGQKIALIWTESIIFQKFQRYVFGEYTVDYYLDFVFSHESSKPRVIPLYSNDIEVIGFRPGRYQDEAPILEDEWSRVYAFYQKLKQGNRVKWRLPHQLLVQLDPPDAGNLLQLTSAEQPIPVKKQFKYNISRWAVTGRDDVNLNTRCYQFLQAILADEKLDTLRNWRQLCDLWSSDFRTHITQRRWMLFQRKLTRFALKLGVKEPQVGIGIAGADWLEVNESCQLNGFDLTLNKEMHSLTVKGENVHLELNLWRGLAIQTLAFASHDFQPSIGTLHHGYFDSIALGADFYSATTVIELVESHSRLTDLVPVDVFMAECEQGIMLQSQVMTQLGSLTKTYTISKTESVTYTLEFSFTERPRGVVRVGNFTLVSNPSDAKRWYRVKNGGTQFEQFELGAHCAHCEPASTLVTARTGLGATSGEIQIGDKDHALSLTWNPADCAAFPMVCHEVHDKNALTRVVFSLSELDETSIQGGRLLPFEVTLKPLVNHD